MEARLLAVPLLLVLAVEASVVLLLLRDELREESFPAFGSRGQVSGSADRKRERKAKTAHTCFAHLNPQLLHRSLCPDGPLLHSGVSLL
jgi:hypothetical protein